MPTTTSSSTTVVNIAPAELTSYVQTNIANLVAADCDVLQSMPGVHQANGPRPALYLTWPISRQQLDTFLKTIIPNLPANMAYTVRLVQNNPDVAATVSWSS